MRVSIFKMIFGVTRHPSGGNVVQATCQPISDARNIKYQTALCSTQDTFAILNVITRLCDEALKQPI